MARKRVVIPLMLAVVVAAGGGVGYLSCGDSQPEPVAPVPATDASDTSPVIDGSDAGSGDPVVVSDTTTPGPARITARCERSSVASVRMMTDDPCSS